MAAIRGRQGSAASSVEHVSNPGAGSPDGTWRGMQTVALIVAAGRGERFGGTLPKQYAGLGGIPVLRRSIVAFAEHPSVDGVRVGDRGGRRATSTQAPSRAEACSTPVIGGATRQDTVRNGLESLAESGTGQGADPRRGATAGIDRGDRPRRSGARHALAVLPVVPVVDTLKRVEPTPRSIGEAEQERPRRVPRRRKASGSRRSWRRTGPRAVAAIPTIRRSPPRPGLRWPGSSGEERNIKLTLPQDLRMAERLLDGGPSWRTGLGFDVHAFAPERPLILCGVRIPHELGLAGHSDADVAFHAITDAILGTIAAGDIGSHFPPSDPQWRDADFGALPAPRRRICWPSVAAGSRTSTW